MDLPSGRSAIRTRPSTSIKAIAATNTVGKPAFIRTFGSGQSSIMMHGLSRILCKLKH
jgi:hypothetical protein